MKDWFGNYQFNAAMFDSLALTIPDIDGRISNPFWFQRRISWLREHTKEHQYYAVVESFAALRRTLEVYIRSYHYFSIRTTGKGESANCTHRNCWYCMQ